MSETQSKYKDTVNLPQTSFPMKGDLPKREPEWLAQWQNEGLYSRIRTKGKQQKQSYVLHDGPPYANGNIHIGHALNKILKDMIVKYQTMRGKNAQYVPGWDCHGLPIELQALKEAGKKKEEIPQVEFRQKARAYAEKYVGIQREEFVRLGIFGDWQNPYLTMNYSYQAAIAGSFLKLHEKNYIEQRLKPVPWCWDCETALADAEIEYEDKSDETVYVLFSAGDASYLVWTTTPWTLPANVGLAVHPDLEYAVLETGKGKLICARSLVSALQEKLGLGQVKEISVKKGKDFAGSKAKHPFLEREAIVICADYVTAADGTGIVHIAPGHGEEDYRYGYLQNKLEIISPVDSRGKFTKDFELGMGLRVLKEGNEKVVEILKEKGALLHAEKYAHSYPHCWRCKKPIVYRATKQWFLKIDEQGLRKKLSAEIEKQISFHPAWGKNRIGSMVETRPDWCLSRQRYWGVPIPVISCENCGKTFVSESKDEIVKQFAEHGADVWFEKESEAFLAGTKISCCAAPKLKKETDILDVWFDSGVSHQAVLKNNPELSFPADLYLEGSDQHRGWFQVSLITATALEGRAPFKSVLTHGFVVDGEGRKMSKSQGNVISPQEVIKQYGADVLRLWVSSCDYQFDIRLSKEILARIVEAYRRLRNTFRYLLGNVHGFDARKDALAWEELESVDQWILMEAAVLLEQVQEKYDTFEFYQIYKLVYEFCTTHLSNFYLDILKDRMYCDGLDWKTRRSSQTAFYHLLRILLKVLAPILPFTCDEAWKALPAPLESASVHEADWPELAWVKRGGPAIQAWKILFRLRNLVNEAVEKLREQGKVGSSLEAEVVLAAQNPALYAFLSEHASLLSLALVVSKVELQNSASAGPEAVSRMLALEEGQGEWPLSIYVRRTAAAKCERCWRHVADVGSSPEHPSLCLRCAKAVSGV